MEVNDTLHELASENAELKVTKEQLSENHKDVVQERTLFQNWGQKVESLSKKNNDLKATTMNQDCLITELEESLRIAKEGHKSAFEMLESYNDNCNTLNALLVIKTARLTEWEECIVQ